MFLICYMHFYHMYPIMKCLMSFKNWLPSFFCAFILWLSEILIRKWFSWIRLLLVHLASWSVLLHQSLAINTYAGFIIGIKIGKLRDKHFLLLIFFLLVKLLQETCIPSMSLVSDFLPQVIPHYLPPASHRFGLLARNATTVFWLDYCSQRSIFGK